MTSVAKVREMTRDEANQFLLETVRRFVSPAVEVEELNILSCKYAVIKYPDYLSDASLPRVKLFLEWYGADHDLLYIGDAANDGKAVVSDSYFNVEEAVGTLLAKIYLDCDQTLRSRIRYRQTLIDPTSVYSDNIHLRDKIDWRQDTDIQIRKYSAARVLVKKILSVLNRERDKCYDAD